MGINDFVKIGSRIKKIRMEKGLSQRDVAKELEIPFSTYSNYENDNREPPKETLKKIAGILGVEVGALLGWETEKVILPGRLKLVTVDDPESDFYKFTIEAEDEDAYKFGLKIFQEAGALPEEAREEIMAYVDFIKSRIKNKTDDTE